LLGLVYVQNVERALGNAFLVVIPAAVVFLVRVRVGAALLAVLLNGLLTARVGLSSSLLPPTPLLLVAAGLAAAWTLWRSRLVRLAPAALLLVGLGGCAPTSSDTRPPPGPTATAAAVATRTRESANAQVRRILAGDQGGTPTPSATPTPRPSCADAIWWYEARAHVGEQRTVEGPVVRVRRLPGGTLLELGQLYPDPTGFAVLLTGPLAAQTYADKSVCVSGTITVDEGTPTVRGGDMIAIRVLD
jgi:hypothetical protein